MTQELPSEEEKSRYIQRMFAGIAPRYDLLNRLLSLGIDRRWRNFTAKLAVGNPRGRYLDVCCGTGDLALAVRKRAPEASVIGSDFVMEMVERGQAKADKRRGNGFAPLLADTLQLPFADASFDGVTVGFGIRNVANLERGIAEMARVTKPGGRVAVLEFTQPKGAFLRKMYMLYFTQALPRIGNAVSQSDMKAYSYLPASVAAFPDADGLAEIMRAAGLPETRYYLRTFGIAAAHIGVKA